MRVMALANQKGGCGKTTTAVNLAAALARLDRRVLLIDNDPQGHATLALGVGERDFSLSTYDLYLTSDILVEDIFVEAAPGLHLVPAGVELSAVEQALAGQEGREERLRDKLRRSAMTYDDVLIDCAPGVGLLSFNALMAADEILAPLDASYQSLQAVRKLEETLAVLHEHKNHEIRLRLVLANFDLRPLFARAVARELEERYPRALLETVIHPTVRFKEALALGLSILDHDPRSRGALDIGRLAAELTGAEARQVTRPAAAATTGKEATTTAAERPRRRPAHWVPRLAGPRIERDGVLFLADFPGAKRVHLTGTFCGWCADALPMRRRGDGLWSLKVALEPGTYEYRYVADGAWLPDPHNEASVPNEFGGANSVLKVPEQAREAAATVAAPTSPPATAGTRAAGPAPAGARAPAEARAPARAARGRA